ncbi:MAG: TPM domain-containing protein [Kofleriaceae bacterium]|nr:TPM domain-containing protein [Kofleriaceae bacterium]
MVAALLAAVVALASAAPIPPSPTTWVTDTAGMMTPGARDALDARLAAYERATGHQVVVWIGATIGDTPLDDWAVRTFAAWKVGRAGLDDGIVMFVLAQDRKIDIEVGYGLEGQVPDAVASRIIREVMAPKLRAGNADAAITDGANALLTAIQGTPWVDDGTVATQQAAREETPWLTYVLGGVALIAFLVLLVTHPQAALMLLWSISSGRGGGSIGGGGGGFSGGGGRSGGGGARGGW